VACDIIDTVDGDPETEPDYRFTLANERTFLAWVRTSLGLLAAGVAIDQFAPRLGITGARTAVGLAFVALSILSVLGGVFRWRAVDAAMRREAALPRVRLPWILAGGLAVLALVVAVTVAVGTS